MRIYVYTLTFAINKNCEGSTASTSRVFASREKAEEWLEDFTLVPENFLSRHGFGDVKKVKAFFIFV